MVKATWRSLALCALMGVVAPVTLVQQAAAQIVIGGDTQPDVVVNWSVLDGLGQQRSLADLLKDDLPGRTPSSAQAPAPARAKAGAPQGLAYKPFKAGAAVKPAKTLGAAPAVKPVKQAHAKPAPVAKPAAVKVADAAKPEPVKAPEPAKMLEPVKAAEPAKVVSQTPPALPAKPKMAEIAPVAPSVPAAAAQPTPITKPVESAKVEAPKAPDPVPAPAPVVAAAPPPAPSAPVVPAPVAPVPVVQAPAPSVPAVPAPALPALTAPALPAQVASLPSAEPPTMGGGDTISLAFDVEDAKVGDRAKSDLALLIKRLQKDEDLNLQLLAYASGDDASKARRLSLSRALEVRKILMDKGIRSTRIEVRALGSKVDGRGGADRVDAVLVGR